jgi:hypothetical protein
MGAEDAKASRRLEAALGQVCRTDGIAQGAFAETEAHAGYARHHGASRANALSSLLLLDLLGKEAENASAEYAAVAALRRSLFLPCCVACTEEKASPRNCRILALGGGPGFEAAALESVASFIGSTIDVVEVWVADNEPQWQSTCMAVASALAAMPSTRPTNSAASGPKLKVNFVLADVTKPLDAPENDAISPLVATLDLVLFSYVLVETAALSRVGGWQLLHDLGQRLPYSSHVIALDATHRVWPEAIAALRAGAGRRGVAVWLPTWRTKIRLIVRIGGGKQGAMSTLTSMTPVNLARCIADAGAASTSQRVDVVVATAANKGSIAPPPAAPGNDSLDGGPIAAVTSLRSRLWQALATSGAQGPLSLDYRPNVAMSYPDNDSSKLLKLDFGALRRALLAEEVDFQAPNLPAVSSLLAELDEAEADATVAFAAKRSVTRLRKSLFMAAEEGRQVERELAQLSTFYFTDVVASDASHEDPEHSAVPPSFEHGATYAEISRAKAGVRGATRACNDVLDITNQLCSLPRCPADGDEGGPGNNGTVFAASRVKTLPAWLLTTKDVRAAAAIISVSCCGDGGETVKEATSLEISGLGSEEDMSEDDRFFLPSGALLAISVEAKCSDLSSGEDDDKGIVRRSAALVLVARGASKAESIRQGAARAAHRLGTLAQRISATVVALQGISSRDLKTEQLLQSLSAAAPVVATAAEAFARASADSEPAAASGGNSSLSEARLPSDFFLQARSIVAAHRPALLEAVLASKALHSTLYKSAPSATSSRRPWTVPGKARCACCQRSTTAVWLTVATGVCIECMADRPRRGMPNWRPSEQRGEKKCKTAN